MTWGRLPAHLGPPQGGHRITGRRPTEGSGPEAHGHHRGAGRTIGVVAGWLRAACTGGQPDSGRAGSPRRRRADGSQTTEPPRIASPGGASVHGPRYRGDGHACTHRRRAQAWLDQRLAQTAAVASPRAVEWPPHWPRTVSAKSDREAGRAAWAAHHQAHLAALGVEVDSPIDGFGGGRPDPFEVDRVLPALEDAHGHSGRGVDGVAPSERRDATESGSGQRPIIGRIAKHAIRGI